MGSSSPELTANAFIERFNAGDAAGFAQLYAEDAIFTYDGVEKAVGRRQIEEGAVGRNGAGTTILGSIFANEMIGNSGTNIMFGLGGADTYRAGDGLDYVYLVGVTTSEIQLTDFVV